MGSSQDNTDELKKKQAEMKYAVGSQGKEFDPFISSPDKSESEALPESLPSPEDTGKYVTPPSNTIHLPPDLQKLGLKTEEETLFMETLNKVKLPISDERIVEDLKAPPSEARRWYATILIYILRRAHITLKTIGAKVIRVFTSR